MTLQAPTIDRPETCTRSSQRASFRLSSVCRRFKFANLPMGIAIQLRSREGALMRRTKVLAWLALACIGIGAHAPVLAENDSVQTAADVLVRQYLLCEDLDCVDALRDLKTCSRRCVPALLKSLQVGLPREWDLRSPESSRTKSAQALGELGDRRAVAPLTRTLRDLSPLLRAASAHALGQLKTPVALEPLRAALRAETDPHARSSIEAALLAIEMR